MYPDYVKQIPKIDLPEFCEALRQKLIDSISNTGGHIGVNLGVIELTVALYRVFDFPTDSLIWDIGHQIYVQRMITGRMLQLNEIRQNGGSPGYSNSDYNNYERVTSSHAGASLSLGLGVALSNQLNNDSSISIAVIGDGSYVEGSTQEAINHMAVENCKMLVVLNDNEMALDNNFGGIHEYFKSRQSGTDEKETYFSSLGIPYDGPIDGHDVLMLVEKLEEIKNNLAKPTILHVKTIKGKGLEHMADKSPVRIHWNFPFNPVTGENTENPKAKSYAAFGGKVIDEILTEDENAVLISPATLQNTGIFNAFNNHKTRSFDVSLAEQHSMTLSGGFALQGKKPILCFESTFMPRVFDQLVHDVCINNLPVLIVSVRSGHTGLDHLTHHAMLDISYLRCIPNLRILYPSTTLNFAAAIKKEYSRLSCPTIILSPYANTLDDPENEIKSDTDKSFKKTSNARGIILSVGPQNINAVSLKGLMDDQDILFDHMAVTMISPIADPLINILSDYEYIITMEEGILQGGFGSRILEVLSDNHLKANVLRVGFDKKLIEHGTRDYIYKKYKIDYKSIFEQLKVIWPELIGGNK